MDSATLPAVDRRRFLAAAGGLTLGFVLPAASPAGHVHAAAAVTQVNAWLRIGSDESVVLTIGSSDMGQGSSAGLAQILAEDLMVDWSRVAIVQGGPTLASPAPLGSAINTVGSGVTRNNFWKLRDAGAAAREMLVAAAMQALGDSDRSRYTVRSGVVRHASGRALSYGQLADAASRLTPPADAALVPDAELTCIGQPLPRPDIPRKVDGSAVYGIDVRLPGMLYAAIRHCPSFGGTLAATPSKPSGVIAVIPTTVAAGTGRGADLAGNVNAVAAVATNTWDAMQAAKRLSLKWTLPANAPRLNSTQFLADALALLDGGTPYAGGSVDAPGTVYTVERSAGDAAAAIAASPTVVEATYGLPYVAHACMEVLNCTVDYVAGTRCEVWAPTQSSRGALGLVMALTGLPADRVTIHTTFLGGGLGRKAEQDFVAQAVQVGMALGRPVKLMWPREEDFTHDQYRPMGLIRVRAGLDASGYVSGWSYRNVSPSILAQRGVALGAKGDSQGYEASQGLPYDFGARLTEWVSHPSPVPVGFWRSVGASLNTFAVESMIDELAAAARQDPLQFRRARLTDPRWLAVLEAAAAAGGWSTPPAGGRARGIAIGTAFNSIVAQVVEIASSGTSGFRVVKVSAAIDCTRVVNPAQVEAQITGGIVHGLNAALYGQQTFVNGAAQTKNFNRSRMIRLQEMPQVSVTIVPPAVAPDRGTPIGGVGELGVPTLAPALANAWFRLSGQRVRSLPFFPGATMGG